MNKIIYRLLIVITVVFTFSCNKESAFNNETINKSGSITKFTIINNYLYTLNKSNLDVYDKTDSRNPKKVNAIPISSNIETIFSYNNNLYLGATDGIYIVDITVPEQPILVGRAVHTLGCDPVVVLDNIAYSTVRNGRTCNNGIPSSFNQLMVYNVANSNTPILITTFSMNEPQGLGFDDNYLFVCDGSFGVRIFDISNRINPVYVGIVNGLNAIDVIVDNNLLIVSTEKDYTILDYSNIANITVLSKIAKQ